MNTGMRDFTGGLTTSGEKRRVFSTGIGEVTGDSSVVLNNLPNAVFGIYQESDSSRLFSYIVHGANQINLHLFEVTTSESIQCCLGYHLTESKVGDRPFTTKDPISSSHTRLLRPTRVLLCLHPNSCMIGQPILTNHNAFFIRLNTAHQHHHHVSPCQSRCPCVPRARCGSSEPR